MTKQELAKEVAHRTGVATDIVHSIIDETNVVIMETLEMGINIYQRGFGTFEVVSRKAKTGRNIGKGTKVSIPACKVPHFKPCKEFVATVKQANVC